MKYTLPIILLVFLVVGCSSTPKLEDYTNNPNGMWDEGKRLWEQGSNFIRNSQRIRLAQSLLILPSDE